MELDTDEVWVTWQFNNLSQKYTLMNHLEITVPRYLVERKKMVNYCYPINIVSVRYSLIIVLHVTITSMRRPVSSLPTNERPASSSCDVISGLTCMIYIVLSNNHSIKQYCFSTGEQECY